MPSSCTGASTIAAAATHSRDCGRSRSSRRDREPVDITVDGEPIEARVVLVSNNAYTLEVLSIGERARLDEGHLHLYAPQGLMRTGWEEREGERFTIDARLGRLRAAVDGEPELLDTPIDFRVEPRALRVLVPRGPLA